MKTRFICNSCDYEQAKWLGRCPSCGQYNTFEEVAVKKPDNRGVKGSTLIEAAAKPVGAQLLQDVSVSGEIGDRLVTGISELDRVLGGGIVGGSLILLGGDPGIGKSTLLLQICKNAAMAGDSSILYISGEEGAAQIKMRAERLAVKAKNCYLLAETDLYAIRDAANSIKPRLLLIDSIQTMRHTDLTSLPGSVSQVRECAAFFTHLAKQHNMAVILVGHVTKEGSLAGPRVLEHMVDTVLYFEGESSGAYRLIRAAKNRFGSTNEVGVFEMTEHGLSPIDDPSAYMLAGRPEGVAGSVVTCSMEGSRSLLAEVQALVSATSFGTPRRTATGVDYNRMVMLMAVLEKRAGYKLQNFDAYVNIAGGLKITEPAADAGMIAALASCYKDKPLAPGVMVIGEVGLAGEMRAVNQPERRVIEASRHGFTACVLPQANKTKLRVPEGFKVYGAAHIGELLGVLL